MPRWNASAQGIASDDSRSSIAPWGIGSEATTSKSKHHSLNDRTSVPLPRPTPRSARIGFHPGLQSTLNRAVDELGAWEHPLIGVIGLRAVLEDSELPGVEGAGV